MIVQPIKDDAHNRMENWLRCAVTICKREIQSLLPWPQDIGMAGMEGIEPPFFRSEPNVLPLYDIPKIGGPTRILT